MKPPGRKHLSRRNMLFGAVGTAAGLAASPAARAQVSPEERRSASVPDYRLAVAAYSYRQHLQGAGRDMTLLDFIRVSAEMGSDGVELTEYYFEKPVTQAYLLDLKRTAQVWGQTITGTPIGNRFTHPPGPEREKELQRYREWVDVSAKLGSPCIRTFAGSTPAGTSDEQARRWAIECLEQACDYAGRRGIFVALENHGGVAATADAVLEIVRSVRSPWMAVNLDTGNFRTPDPYGDLARCAPHSVAVQYKVEMFPAGLPPQEADFPRIVRILREAGYRGFITLEYEASEEPRAAVPRHLAAMRAHLRS
jgi:sugar phosphate isomerase/epimerase